MKKNARKESKPWFFIVIASVIFTLAIIIGKKASEHPKPVQYFQPPLESTMQEPLGIRMTDKKDGKVLVDVPGPEVVKLINDLLAAINPSDQENSYMTPFMKEKINWAFTEIAAGRLLLNPYGGFFKNADGSESFSTMMSSGYTRQAKNSIERLVPFIDISVARILMMLRVQQKRESGFSRMAKNTFALTFVHEATHLENSVEYFNRWRTPEEQAEEEYRVWYDVDVKAVKGLRKAGQPVDKDFVEVDDLLMRCGYKRECPGFISYIKNTGKIPH